MEQRIATIPELRAWADQLIAERETLADWLLDLATERAERPEDILAILRRAKPEPLDPATRARVVLTGYTCGRSMLNLTLRKLFHIMCEGSGDAPFAFPERIAKLLGEWDRLDDLEARSGEFEERSNSAFRSFLQADPGFAMPFAIAEQPSP